MILIISYSGGTVNHVIDWITSQGIEVHRINPYLEKVNISLIQLTENECEVELNLPAYGVKTKLSDYTGIWVWHSNLWFSNCEIQLGEEQDQTIKTIITSLEKHHTVLINYVAAYLTSSQLNIIGNYNSQNLNKLEVLLKAKKLGIKIPNSHIISQQRQISEILKHSSLITKPYYEVAYPIYNEAAYQNYTSDVLLSDVEQDEAEIFPTLVQEKINKQFEIRSFYLHGKFYSMAIFSQASSQTEIDFRNYNYENPNRTVPFKLPDEVENKLRLLFEKLDLNSGSADIVYSTSNEYVFLEINPVGQFGMISYPCNYYLEKLIMEALIDGNRHK